MIVKWAPNFEISAVPLRKVIRRSSPNTNGWHRTQKNPGGYCGGESTGELEFMLFAEMDPNVSAIAPQPCTIPFSHDGKLCRHIPSFAIIERGESILFDAKSRRQYDQLDVKRRLRSAGRSIEAGDWPYFVVLKEDVLSDRRYPNVYDVWRRFRRSYNDLQRLALEGALIGGERVVADVLTELSSRMGTGAPTFEDILSLAANHCIFIDVEQPIERSSIIRFADPAALPEPLLPRRRPADDLPWEVAT